MGVGEFFLGWVNVHAYAYVYERERDVRQSVNACRAFWILTTYKSLTLSGLIGGWLTNLSKFLKLLLN